MNKKILIIFSILFIVGLFLLQGCSEDAIGKKFSRKFTTAPEEATPRYTECKMVHFDENGEVTNERDYYPDQDVCLTNNGASRIYYGAGKFVGASCLNVNECDTCGGLIYSLRRGECKNKEELIELCL